MKKQRLVAVGLAVILLSFGIGVQQGFSWEGATSSWTPGYFEEARINATTEFYRAGVNYTQYIDDTYLSDDGSETLDISGTFSATDINATTEFYRGGSNYTAWIDDTYLLDDGSETLDITGTFSATDINATAEFYRGGVNYTAWIESKAVSIYTGATYVIGQNSTRAAMIENYVYCDGTADDAQINAAFANPGVIVQLESNTIYDVDAPIEMDEEYQELWGMGRSTVLRADNNLEDNIVELTGNAEWFQVVKDLQIDGNKANNAAGHSVYISHVYGTTDCHVTLTDLWIVDSADAGVYIPDGTGTREPHLTRVIVTDSDGISFRVGGTDSKFVHCVSENPQSHGFQVYSNGQFTHCKSFGAGKGGAGHGWYFSGQTAGAVQVVNCIAEDSENAGFLVWNANNIQFSGCEANSNGQEGFYINAAGGGTNSSEVGIIGSQSWSRSGGLHIQTYGIRLSANTDHCYVVGTFAEEGSIDGISNAGSNVIDASYDGTTWVSAP